MIQTDRNKKFKVEPIKGDKIDKGNFSLTLIDKATNKVIHVEENFTDAVEFNTTYYRDLFMLFTDEDTGQNYHIENSPLVNVSIEVHSRALGDQLAWMPIVDLFQKKHECTVIVNCYFTELFEPFYPNLIFRKISDDSIIKAITDYEISATYILGYSVSGKKNTTDGSILSPVDCRITNLQDVAKHQLGLQDVKEEVKPKMFSNIKEPIIKGKYVCITTMATAQFKLWNNPKGYPELIKYFKSKGYNVVDVGNVSDNLKGTIVKSGYLEWNELMNIIENAELFVSGANGLQWLAWAVGQKVLTINGSTDPKTLFKHTQVIDTNLCNSCFNDSNIVYDNTDVKFCPRKKNFECTRLITSETVIEAIEKNNLLK